MRCGCWCPGDIQRGKLFLALRDRWTAWEKFSLAKETLLNWWEHSGRKPRAGEWEGCCLGQTGRAAVSPRGLVLGPWVWGRWEGQLSHETGPGTRWMRISMPSLPCALPLELFLSGVSGTCCCCQRAVIPDPVKARGKVLLPHRAPQWPRQSRSKPQVPVGVSPSAGPPAAPGSCHLLDTFLAGWPESQQGPVVWWHCACWQQASPSCASVAPCFSSGCGMGRGGSRMAGGGVVSPPF